MAKTPKDDPKDAASGLDVQRFWQHMINRHPKERGDGRATAEGTRWHRLDDFDLIISLTVGSRQVRLFVRGDADAKATVAGKKLAGSKEALQRALGVGMGSDEYGRFFIDQREIDLTDEGNWDAAVDWLFERSQDYEAALTENLKSRR